LIEVASRQAWPQLQAKNWYNKLGSAILVTLAKRNGENTIEGLAVATESEILPVSSRDHDIKRKSDRLNTTRRQMLGMEDTCGGLQRKYVAENQMGRSPYPQK